MTATSSRTRNNVNVAAAATASMPMQHGSAILPAVEIVAYNAELRDDEGFVGDRASNRAFRAILEDWRERLRQVAGEDPIGDTPSDEISKKKLDKVLTAGEPEAAGVVHAAIEDFANELATVTTRFLRLKAWRDVTRIAVGGGLRESRVGELAIGRASVMLKAKGKAIDLVPIHNHPDGAGLIGAVHLAPSWMFTGYDGILAIDVGGSNIRAGVVAFGDKLGKADKAKAGAIDLSACRVHVSELWRHCEESPKREEAVARILDMLRGLVRAAGKDHVSLAPFIGVGCPGVIEADGSIARGGQNLPGNWESSRFNFPHALLEGLPTIGEHPTHVIMHNDAVVQGLSELPAMLDVPEWGILTIGTGLGNASFRNRVEGIPRSESEPPSA